MSLVGSLCLLASTYKSPDGEAIQKFGFFHGWTFWTLVKLDAYTSLYFVNGQHYGFPLLLF